jgi:hypothetical protein
MLIYPWQTLREIFISERENDITDIFKKILWDTISFYTPTKSQWQGNGYPAKSWLCEVILNHFSIVIRSYYDSSEADLGNTGKFEIWELLSWVWWHTPVIPTFRRLRQEDCEFEVNLDYTGNWGQSQLHSETLSQKSYKHHCTLLHIFSIWMLI